MEAQMCRTFCSFVRMYVDTVYIAFDSHCEEACESASVFLNVLTAITTYVIVYQRQYPPLKSIQSNAIASTVYCDSWTVMLLSWQGPMYGIFVHLRFSYPIFILLQYSTVLACAISLHLIVMSTLNVNYQCSCVVPPSWLSFAS